MAFAIPSLRHPAAGPQDLRRTGLSVDNTHLINFTHVSENLIKSISYVRLLETLLFYFLPDSGRNALTLAPTCQSSSLRICSSSLFNFSL